MRKVFFFLSAALMLTLLQLESFSNTPVSVIKVSDSSVDLQNKSRIMIRVYESFNHLGSKSEILITQDGKTERVELKMTKDSNRNDINKLIFDTLLKYLNNGYKIENSSAISIDVVAVTTYILIKE